MQTEAQPIIAGIAKNIFIVIIPAETETAINVSMNYLISG
jgi:hypothetical protein